MDINKAIGDKLKELRIKKGYSLEEISNMINVTKQGYYLWEQGLRTCRFDILSILSIILEFKITIKDGEFDISECIISHKNREVDFMDKKLLNTTELQGFKIIKLFTGASNINFKYNEILEETLIYKDECDAIDFFDDNIVPVYALFDDVEKAICYNTYSLDKHKIYSFYYWNYAPILDDENTIYVNIEKNIKVAKRYVGIDLNNQNSDGTYPVLSISLKKEDNLMGMFLVTDMYGYIIPQLNYISENFPKIFD